MSPQITPTRLNLQRDKQLEVEFQDGKTCLYSIAYLRQMCPCATCKAVRTGADPHSVADPTPKKKPLLTILPGNYAEPLTAINAELVGNYALRIDWSDDHGAGIYSFQYLRDICPA